MRVVLHQQQGFVRHDDHGADDQKHGHERKKDIEDTAQNRPLGGRMLAVGGHDTLKHVLLRNGAQHHGDGGRKKENQVFEVGLGPKLEQVLADRQIQHLVGATGLLTREHSDGGQADHQDDHLHEVGHRHRPHAAKQGVGQDGHHANHHAHGQTDATRRQEIEHQTQRRDLGGHPTQITDHDDDRADHLHGAPIALAVIVADGQQVHAVQLGGEKHTHQNQTTARAKRVFDHAVQAAVDELGRNAQHGFRTEPGGEGGGDDHGQGQVPAGHRKVGRALDPFGGQQANGDGDQQIDNNQGQQHGPLPLRNSRLKLQQIRLQKFRLQQVQMHQQLQGYRSHDKTNAQIQNRLQHAVGTPLLGDQIVQMLALLQMALRMLQISM